MSIFEISSLRLVHSTSELKLGISDARLGQRLDTSLLPSYPFNVHMFTPMALRFVSIFIDMFGFRICVCTCHMYTMLTAAPIRSVFNLPLTPWIFSFSSRQLILPRLQTSGHCALAVIVIITVYYFVKNLDGGERF